MKALVLLLPLAIACSSSKDGDTNKPAPAPEPATEAAAPAKPAEPEPETKPAEPPAKKTESCSPMASDHVPGDDSKSGAVCATAWECDETSVDVGCYPKKGAADAVVCTCSSAELDEDTVVEIKRADCKSVDLAWVNANCGLASTLAAGQ